MEANPQIIERTIPAWRNKVTGEYHEEHTYGDRTGKWEAREDGVTTLSSTREKAEEFCRFILAHRKKRTEEETDGR